MYLNIFLAVVFVPCAMGHGYLAIPPARNSMWREGFDSPKNYNDMELNCGGFSNQWDNNGGLCGLCGDPFEQSYPRDHEAGGYYAPTDRQITRCYNTIDHVMDITVRITSHHQGYFEFRLCANNDMTSDELACTDGGILLTIAGTYGLTHYDINDFVQEYYHFQLNIPMGIECTQCILHWRYNAGNNWGCDDTGCGMGLGPQEQFINCADVAIVPDCKNEVMTTDSGTPASTGSPGSSGSTGSEGTVGSTNGPIVTNAPTVKPSGRCYAVGAWAGLIYMDGWCTFNCLHPAIKHCPPTYCSCGGDVGPKVW